MFNPIGSKATVCAFTLTPNVIITGHESGKVALFNVKSGEEIDNNERAHSDVVTDLQLSKDRTYCITSSKDKAARVCSLLSDFLLVFKLFRQIHDTKNLMVIKTYNTETPLNSASLAPNRPYVSDLKLYLKVQLIPSFVDSAWWWSRSHECNDNICSTGQVRNTVLAQGV